MRQESIEFYSEGAFLRQLNDGGTEAVAGIRWLTLRGDSGDIFFQPTRIRWGHAEEPSGLIGRFGVWIREHI